MKGMACCLRILIMKKIMVRLFIVFSLVMAFYLIPNRYLNVQPETQYPNMPNGCEVTALEMLMKNRGYNISNETLNDRYLKKSGLNNADPNEAYIGSPYKNGYYSYAKPIAEAANLYFKSIGVKTKAEDKTGMSIFGVLNNVIFYKRPVAVWYTIDGKAPSFSKNYYTDKNGVRKYLYSNLHCVVVDGVGRGMVSFVDPIKGRQKVNFAKFTMLYYQMGQRSVVID